MNKTIVIIFAVFFSVGGIAKKYFDTISSFNQIKGKISPLVGAYGSKEIKEGKAIWAVGNNKILFRKKRTHLHSDTIDNLSFIFHPSQGMISFEHQQWTQICPNNGSVCLPLDRNISEGLFYNGKDFQTKIELLLTNCDVGIQTLDTSDLMLAYR